MIMRNFLFANNVLKCCMESLYQMGVVVSSKTICQALKTNADAILNNLQNHSMQFKKFFLSYNNMNFYKRVCNQWLHNYTRMLSSMAKYIYFMKVFDRLPMPQLTSNNIEYSAINKLLVENILLSLSGEQYQLEAIRYILSITFEKYFGKTLRN